MKNTTFRSSLAAPPLLLAACVMGALIMTGCETPEAHQARLKPAKEREMTVGIVQKEIRVGMSQADVAEELGSPNIVTKDQNAKGTWIYDKIATEVSYSDSSSSISGAAGAGQAVGDILRLGGVGVNHSRQSGARSTSQKTLTVIIRFDDAGRVASFSYHSSKF